MSDKYLGDIPVEDFGESSASTLVGSKYSDQGIEAVFVMDYLEVTIDRIENGLLGADREDLIVQVESITEDDLGAYIDEHPVLGLYMALFGVNQNLSNKLPDNLNDLLVRKGYTTDNLINAIENAYCPQEIPKIRKEIILRLLDKHYAGNTEDQLKIIRRLPYFSSLYEIVPARRV